MAKRNLTLAEKRTVQHIVPNIKINEWLMKQKHLTYYVLRKKSGAGELKIPLQLGRENT